MNSDKPSKDREEIASLKREINLVNQAYHQQISEKHKFKSQVEQKDKQNERLRA
jgi:hypothetical protein